MGQIRGVDSEEIRVHCPSGPFEIRTCWKRGNEARRGCGRRVFRQRYPELPLVVRDIHNMTLYPDLIMIENPCQSFAEHMQQWRF